MSINLTKGQRVDLSKESPNMTSALIGLGWEENTEYGEDYDLDAAAFLLGTNGKCATEEDFIFYKNLVHNSDSVVHYGDNLTGGDGTEDDEQILVKLNEVPSRIDRIVFTVTIYDAEKRRQNFGSVRNAYIRVIDNTTGVEVIRYDLTEDYSIETAVVVGELYRHNGQWKFNAVGSGYQGGLAALCNKYGIEVA